MYRTFNYGLGIVLIAPKKDADDIISRLNGLNENAYLIGEIMPRADIAEQVELT